MRGRSDDSRGGWLDGGAGLGVGWVTLEPIMVVTYTGCFGAGFAVSVSLRFSHAVVALPAGACICDASHASQRSKRASVEYKRV